MSVVANEVIDFVSKSGKSEIAFKIDFQKACDSVSWGFLIRVLKECGFEDGWCDWIFKCISFVSIYVLVNGSPTDSFTISCGFRQDCSLSPLLFNLIGETLNLMIGKDVRIELFSGFKVGRTGDEVEISHLLFTDNLLIFCGGSKSRLCNIERVLHIVQSNLVLQVGDGRSIFFWSDTWVDNVFLKERLPRIFAIASNKSGFISDFGCKVDSVWVWEVSLGRPLFDWEVEQWNEFSACLNNFKSSNLDHLFPNGGKSIGVPRWMCPSKSFLKLNVDGVVSRLSSKKGIGGLLKDESGSTLLSFFECVGVSAPSLVELDTILVGIRMFIASYWSSKFRLIMELDRKIVVDWLLGRATPPDDNFGYG
ncbi:hypothetical protein V6N11_069839 [Hibiscus sabdariffa]|uniref:Reverse transcriptase domain-containing protein n=1 Tax=Hibiscus sabdariffa TaxID=183260 RepID=A0ABR2Q411_9ROSI